MLHLNLHPFTKRATAVSLFPKGQENIVWKEILKCLLIVVA